MDTIERSDYIPSFAYKKRMEKKYKNESLCCSFCGKSQDDVRKLIAGPAVYVCDECTSLCVETLCKEEADFAKAFVKGLSIDVNLFTEKDGFSSIVREIVFPAEHYEAGMTILNSFSNIVRQRYAKEEVSVSIQQQGLKISLIIETPDGRREAIEETIKEYNLVLSGHKSVDDFSVSKNESLQLTQQLSFAKLQLETNQQLLEMERRHSDQLATHNTIITNQYNEVLTILSIALNNPNEQIKNLSAAIAEISASQNNVVLEACKLLQQKFEKGIQIADEDEVKKALKTIATNSPSTFDKIRNFVESTAAGVAGNYVYSWLISVSNCLPK